MYNTVTFNMVAGIAGSGKTTWAYAHAKPGDVILDSDEIRAEVLGNSEDQNNHALVFQTMYDRALAALIEGRNVWYVATNLRKDFRKATVQRIRDEYYKSDPYRGDTLYTDLWWMKCSLETALERNANRDRHVPEDVIRSMYLSKLKSGTSRCEGWTTITFVEEDGSVRFVSGGH